MFTVGLVGKLLSKAKCLARVELGGSTAPIVKLGGFDLVVAI